MALFLGMPEEYLFYLVGANDTSKLSRHAVKEEQDGEPYFTRQKGGPDNIAAQMRITGSETSVVARFVDELFKHNEEQGKDAIDDRLKDNIPDERFARIEVEQWNSVGNKNDFGNDECADKRKGRCGYRDAILLQRHRFGNKENVEHDKKEDERR